MSLGSAKMGVKAEPCEDNGCDAITRRQTTVIEKKRGGTHAKKNVYSTAKTIHRCLNCDMRRAKATVHY